MSAVGNLNDCQICGRPLELVDGTDPDVARREGEWTERYECPAGHTGRYTRDVRSGAETFHGACDRLTDNIL